MKSTRSGRKYVSKNGKEFVKKIRDQLELDMKTQDISIFSGKVELYIKFYFDNKRKNDLDNHCKTLLDAIGGVLIVDDRLVYKLIVEKEDSCKFSKIDMKISSIASLETDNPSSLPSVAPPPDKKKKNKKNISSDLLESIIKNNLLVEEFIAQFQDN